MTDTDQYLHDQMRSSLKIGDTVLVTRRSQRGEMGWDNDWVSDMDKYIGTWGVIRSLPALTAAGIEIDGFHFPYFVLSTKEYIESLENKHFLKLDV